jgi:hypothetical protein
VVTPAARGPTGRIFATDTWHLYHTDVDRSELHDLAEEEPARLQELVNLWYAEAGANDAFPLDDRSGLELLTTPRPVRRCGGSAGSRSWFVAQGSTAAVLDPAAIAGPVALSE